MIGKQKMTLTYQSMLEALDDYVNMHLRDDRQVQVVSWSVGSTSYTPESQTVEIELLPPGQPETQEAGQK